MLFFERLKCCPLKIKVVCWKLKKNVHIWPSLLWLFFTSASTFSKKVFKKKPHLHLLRFFVTGLELLSAPPHRFTPDINMHLWYNNQDPFAVTLKLHSCDSTIWSEKIQSQHLISPWLGCHPRYLPLFSFLFQPGSLPGVGHHCKGGPCDQMHKNCTCLLSTNNMNRRRFFTNLGNFNAPEHVWEKK